MPIRCVRIQLRPLRLYVTLTELKAMLKRPHTKWLFLILICFVFNCGGADERLNIIMIGVDTLRPDHLGCYGYQRKTSPNIDKLAGQGVLFENVVSQSPWTLPSFATVFTSLYPTQHGASHSATRMRKGFPTMASLLKDNGYATGAIINAPYLKPRYRLTRGFDYYDMPPEEGRVADGTTMDALQWLDGNRHRPFFIFVHYFDPHISYAPPAPYDTIFDPDYAGDIKNAYKPRNLSRIRDHGFEEMKSLTTRDWDHIRALYDGEIAFTDQAIGNLLRGLEERGLVRNTLVVFLSDHGEEFFEHGGFEHGHTLFSELIRVPLIFSLPGQIPGKVRLSRQVRLLDVLPTVLDLVGIVSQADFEGVSLAPLIRGKKGGAQPPKSSLLPAEIAYSEAVLYHREKKSLTAYPWKLILDMKTGKKLFFNLGEDPAEKESMDGTSLPSFQFLENILARTLFDVSDTWYVEMAGGREEHIFNLGLTCEGIGASGGFSFHRLLGADKRITDLSSIDKAYVAPCSIRLKGVRVKEPVTFAFKTVDDDAIIRFDLEAGGRPAADRTFLGKALEEARTMPFSTHDSVFARAVQGEPDHRPQPPYFLVWHSTGEHAEDTRFELDEKTKKELRALGYIQ
jgi:arylsulfatase A-like enzyme